MARHRFMLYLATLLTLFVFLAGWSSRQTHAGVGAVTPSTLTPTIGVPMTIIVTFDVNTVAGSSNTLIASAHIFSFVTVSTGEVASGVGTSQLSFMAAAPGARTLTATYTCVVAGPVTFTASQSGGTPPTSTTVVTCGTTGAALTVNPPQAAINAPVQVSGTCAAPGMILTSSGGGVFGTVPAPVNGQLISPNIAVCTAPGPIIVYFYCQFPSTVTFTLGGAQATLTCAVVQPPLPPTLTKVFGPSTVMVNGQTTATFTLSNPNPTPLTGIFFIDDFPLGTGPPFGAVAGGNCGGSSTITGSPFNFARLNVASVSLAGNASCTVTLPVVAFRPGAHTNTVGGVSAVESGPGPGASATLQVNVAPFTITKSFTRLGAPAATATVGDTLTLVLEVTNPNQFTNPTEFIYASSAVTDHLPSGLQLAPVPNPRVATSGGCFTFNPFVPGGTAWTVTGATPGSTSFTYNQSWPNGPATCQLSIDVVVTSAGALTNTTQPLVTSPANVPATAGATASATINVAPPTTAPTNPTPLPPATPTATPMPPVLPAAPVPQVFQNPAIQGIFNGPRNPNPASTPKPRPALAAVSVPSPEPTIRPPSTGDAGLLLP
jgi:hypothetical protein